MQASVVWHRHALTMSPKKAFQAASSIRDSTCLLFQAVREMPSGQATPMITFVAQHIPSLGVLSVSSPAQAAFGQVLASCLEFVRVEVVSAPTLARAVAELLQNSLNPALQPALLKLSATRPQAAALPTGCSSAGVTLPSLKAQHAQQGSAAKSNVSSQHAQHGSGLDTSEQLFGCLLRLYHSAVALYGQCAATQMQIEPLSGQATGLSTQETPPADQRGEHCRLAHMVHLHCTLANVPG